LNWQWLLDARDEYLNNFSLLDVSHLNIDKEVYIGVYGPTQVGKTTFILHLLGIKEEKLTDLAKALRGKQDIGKSATITATIFRKSKDNLFHLIRPNKSGVMESVKISNKTNLEKEFQELRQDITNGIVKSLEKIIICIPDNYFNNQENRATDLSIVDLPGDDTKDDAEEEHVDRIIAEYLNLCKNIIIMELSSNITSLSQMNLKSLSKWYRNPNKFSVVITRSISDASVSTLISDGEINSPKELENHYGYEISRIIEDDNTTKLENNIYPLELGDSLFSLKKQGLSMYNNIQQWNSIFLENLRKYLEESESPEFEIKNLFNISNLITDTKDEEFKRLKRKEQQYNLEIENLNEDFNVIQLIRGTNQQNPSIKSTGLCGKVMNVQSEINLYESIRQIELVNYTDSVYDVETRNELGITLEIYRESTKMVLRFPKDLDFKNSSTKVDDVNNEYNNYLRNVSRVISEQVKNIERKVNQRGLLDDNFKFTQTIKVLNQETKIGVLVVKKSFFRKTVKEDPYSSKIVELKKDIREAFTKDLKLLVFKLNKLKTTYEILFEQKNKEYQELNDRINELKEKIIEIKEEEDKAEIAWKNELEIGRQLNTFFIEKYRQEMNKILSYFEATSDEDEKILASITMNIIDYQIGRIIEYGSSRKE